MRWFSLLLALLAAWPAQANMVQQGAAPPSTLLIQFVQLAEYNAGSGSSFTTTALPNTVAGNTIVLGIGYGGNFQVSSVTASNGSSCAALANTHLAYSVGLQFWYCHNAVSGNVTFTITMPSVVNYFGVEMSEFSGIAAVAPDAGIGASAAYATMATTAVATTSGNVPQDNALVISKATCGGCTTLYNFPAQANVHQEAHMLYQVISKSGVPASHNWGADIQGIAAVIAVLKH